MVERLSSVARGSITAVGDLFAGDSSVHARFPADLFDMHLKSPPTQAQSLRQRVTSFSSLLNEGALQRVAMGKITLQGVQQKLSDTLERQLGRFGPAGIELYRFAWQRMNRRIIFHLVFYSTLGTALCVLWGLAMWQLWLLMGLRVARRLAWVVAGVLVCALLPPSFPNAAAHGLSLALIAAELVLMGINLVLFGLVHLAVLLNKYILPHWFQRGRVMVWKPGILGWAPTSQAVNPKP
jgi:hypothetical protein